MSRTRAARPLRPWQFRWLLNLYPPLLLQRVRVVEVADDFRTCRVRIAASRITRNLQGTTFGGTIYSAADPFHALLYWQVFAQRGQPVQAWLRAARPRFLKPARSSLELVFRLSDADVEAAADGLARAGRWDVRHHVEALDRQRTPCAAVELDVHLRRVSDS